MRRKAEGTWVLETSSMNYTNDFGKFFPSILLAAALALTGGCQTPAETAGLVATGIVAGAQSPANEMEEVYYVGVFDPDEQLPPSVYRIRVHGQSSVFNGVRFASGWVPANLIDTLSSQINLDANGNSGASITGASTNQSTVLPVGKRMWMFGPEGFRESPADQRLVIVMSSDPSKFFDAVDQTLGIAATATASAQPSVTAVQPSLLAAYKALLSSREQLAAAKLAQSTLKP